MGEQIRMTLVLFLVSSLLVAQESGPKRSEENFSPDLSTTTQAIGPTAYYATVAGRTEPSWNAFPFPTASQSSQTPQDSNASSTQPQRSSKKQPQRSSKKKFG